MRLFLIIVSVPLLLAWGAPADAFLVVAHRGASGSAPEHTFAAWDLALAQGADVIEQDLQLTADGVLVVLHDDSLTRTVRGGAGCTGAVRERTWSELRGCDAGSWFNARYPERARAEFARERIPTLDSVFTRYGARVRYHIETKSPESAPGMEDSLLALVDRHGLRAHAHGGGIFFQSFSAASLQRLRALDARLQLVQLMDDAPGESLVVVLDSVARYAMGVGPSRRFVDERFVREAHARRLVVHPYTVNDVAEMQRLRALGVDGMFTDYPGRLDSLRGR
jgi:glycerophosphoryl diester phosphodiesterase